MNKSKADAFSSCDQRSNLTIPHHMKGNNYEHAYYPDSYNRQHFSPSYPNYHPAHPAHPTYPIHQKYGNFPSNNRKAVISLPQTNQSYQNWDPTHPPSPLKRSSCNGKSNSKHLGNIHVNTQAIPKLLPSPTSPSSISSSEEDIDQKALEEAKTLDLPPQGKFSTRDWKVSLRLCYRWKTETIEHLRSYNRPSTTTNSIPSTKFKSVKNFCDNILKRRTKRRQFAIHWKECGLKKMVDEASVSKNVLFRDDDPRLEKILDDYFSGRTRSTDYNLAKEKALEERQNEIFTLWEALESDPIISRASSRQKLYLMQFVIERPFRIKKVEIEARGQKTIHDVAIDGFGGESYWNKLNTSTKNETEKDRTTDESLYQWHPDGLLPVNNVVIERFWKCSGEYDDSKGERQGKRRRPFLSLAHSDKESEAERDLRDIARSCGITHEASKSEQDAMGTLEEAALGHDTVPLKRRKSLQQKNDKENKPPSHVTV